MVVWWKESLGNGKRFREEGEEDPLVTAQDGEACEQQSMSVKVAMPDAQARHGHQITKHTQGDKGAAGNQKQPTRTAHQKITKCAPAIPKCFQVRRVRCASVAVQGDGHLGDSFAA